MIGMHPRSARLEGPPPYAMNIEIIPLSWPEIWQVWTSKLWAGRSSQIEPTSSMRYLGGYDRSIRASTPMFFGARHGQNIIGVNSVFMTGPTQARSRGIWVDREYRCRGVGQRIMDACIVAARNTHGARSIWSAPRQSSLPFYLSCGFIQTSDFTDDSFEFGPNCYVLKAIP